MEVEVSRSLAEVLREDLGLTGTKIACFEGHCGACTVQVDGVPMLSCITLVHTVEGREITTIEGLREHPLVGAFVRADALQCGFCTPGQIVSAVALVDGEPVLSCITLVLAVEGARVSTIEGLREHPMIDAFVRSDALQCGFCTPGQIVSAVALVESKPAPTTEEIRHAMAGNLCRCGAYPKIEEAIRTWQG